MCEWYVVLTVRRKLQGVSQEKTKLEGEMQKVDTSSREKIQKEMTKHDQLEKYVEFDIMESYIRSRFWNHNGTLWFQKRERMYDSIFPPRWF